MKANTYGLDVTIPYDMKQKDIVIVDKRYRFDSWVKYLYI